MPVIDDLGSGVLTGPVDAARRRCWRTSRRRARSIAAGADVVCFSGDKLLGGPQAGIVAGTRDGDRAAARAPAGARGADRQAVAGGARGDAAPAPRPGTRGARAAGAAHAGAPRGRAGRRARAGCATRSRRRPAGSARARSSRAVGRVGGGALPLLELEGPVVAVAPGARRRDALQRTAAPRRPAGVARVHDGALLLDPRTIADEQAELPSPRRERRSAQRSGMTPRRRR